MAVIVKVTGREILDSRGNPTVEADVILDETGGIQPGGSALRGIHRCP